MEFDPKTTLSETDFRLLDAFAKGQLSADDQAFFATRYRENPAFEAEAKTRRALMQAFFETEKGQFQTDFLAKKRKRQMRRLVFAAFGLAFLAALGWFFFKNRKPKFQHEPIAQTFYPTRKNVLMGEPQKGQTTPSAFIFYDENRFAEAVLAFEKMPPTDTVLLFQASAMLACQPPRTAESLDILRKINSPTTFSDQKDWLEASALLLDGQIGAAKTAFETMAKNQRHGWRVKAEMVLKTNF